MKHFRSWATCLVFVLSVCPSPASAQNPAAPQTLTGQVADITILGTKNIDVNAIRAKLSLKSGDFYTPWAGEKDIAAVQGMGIFNGKVKLNALSALTGGVDLTYTVTENPVVQSIKFTANTPSGQPTVPSGEMFAQMKTRVGQVLNTNILVSDLNALFNHADANIGYVTKQGYLMDVSSDINIDPKTGILTIPLVEYYIKSVQVTGNSRVKTADIMAQMHTKTGDLFNSNAVNEDMAGLYETAEFRTVNYTTSSTQLGGINFILSIVEQAPATGILDEKQGKIIPFLYDPVTMPYPVVQVSVNGKPPLPFIVDTGTTAALSLDSGIITGQLGCQEAWAACNWNGGT